MARNRIETKIETLIKREDWKAGRRIIETQLQTEPDDHWLWARLSAVKYEQRDYQGALEAAEKALEIVPDCPLAGWSKAVALEMVGKTGEATEIYSQLFRRGLQQLKNPDEDANECWEGADWTSGLMADCSFRAAGCLAKTGQKHKAVEGYQYFLGFLDLGIPSIYSRKDALEKLNKLMPSKKAQQEAALKRVVDRKLISAQ